MTIDQRVVRVKIGKTDLRTLFLLFLRKCFDTLHEVSGILIMVLDDSNTLRAYSVSSLLTGVVQMSSTWDV